MSADIIPVLGSVVIKSNQAEPNSFGHVVSHPNPECKSRLKIRWVSSKSTSVEDISDLHSGFLPMMEVQDVPRSRTRKPLGEGTVVKTRTLGHRQQVLVDFPAIGQQSWLPYENLKQIKGVEHRFILGEQGSTDSAEKLRLKSLAYAMELWNENTGSLSQLEIDPLPHQIHLVHHILASGDLNWLIADDVGLGKTIETGMLLAALKQRNTLSSALLVTPAGLTKQWQEELNNKFKMGEFQIYGEDFRINEPRHWKMYDYVITSMDRLKDEKHLESIQSAKQWDIIVFDEAHRLSRRQYGMKFDASQRFQMASSLRQNTDSMLMLTATPHQGMHDKFQALLELLHPERKEEIASLALNPEIIGEMIFRNNKADVTDADGNFIFKGKSTRALKVPVSDQSIEFDKKLQTYLRRGYEQSKSMGFKGNAIGFVMTVYRKLAASSVAAIHNALKNRMARLEGNYQESITTDNLEQKDQRYGEWDEQIDTDSKEFFEGEIELLKSLILEVEQLLAKDKKLDLFISEIISAILASNSKEKVLIFTEYRSTQEYLKNALKKVYGSESVELINGSVPHTLRREAISRFEGKGQFLISTEAGGEGINLQRQCHVMVNYDLPWNPMRLVQRIGRLYRYGQQHQVVVFNIHSPQTADEQIIELMYSRIDKVVDDLAGVSNEYNDRLREDIIGEVAELTDVESILQDATTSGINRTRERIDEALTRAREASSMQKELFEHAASFNPNETKNSLSINREHTAAFVLGMFNQLDIEVTDTTHKGSLWHIRLPDNILEELHVKKSRYAVTVDRLLATERADTHILDLDSFLMRYMIQKAKSYEFEGITGVIGNGSSSESVYTSAVLRWQNDQGNRRRQEYTVYSMDKNGSIKLNPQSFSEWLKLPASTGQVTVDRQRNRGQLEKFNQIVDKRLRDVSNRNLHPENRQWVSAAWVEQ